MKRELTLQERQELWDIKRNELPILLYTYDGEEGMHKEFDKQNIPRYEEEKEEEL